VTRSRAERFWSKLSKAEGGVLTSVPSTRVGTGRPLRASRTLLRWRWTAHGARVVGQRDGT
jgi:hypothetical protein